MADTFHKNAEDTTSLSCNDILY